jgi:hypothetical protein
VTDFRIWTLDAFSCLLPALVTLLHRAGFHLSLKTKHNFSYISASIMQLPLKLPKKHAGKMHWLLTAVIALQVPIRDNQPD